MNESNTHTLDSAAVARVIRCGDILHARSHNAIGWAIRRALGSWGCHDAILVRNEEQELCVGESVWPKAVCTPLAEFDRRIAEKKADVVILRPVTPRRDEEIIGSMAAAKWMADICGKPYDLGAYPRLLLKSIVGDRCPWPVGWEWAWYCTESCRDAWRNGPHIDPWQKDSPTPKTTEKRTIAGAFRVVWTSEPLLPDFTLTTAKYTSANFTEPWPEERFA